jgi:hypothetical protein
MLYLFINVEFLISGYFEELSLQSHLLLESRLVLETTSVGSRNWTFEAAILIKLDCSSEQFEKLTYCLYSKDFKLLARYYCDVVQLDKGRYR